MKTRLSKCCFFLAGEIETKEDSRENLFQFCPVAAEELARFQNQQNRGSRRI